MQTQYLLDDKADMILACHSSLNILSHLAQFGTAQPQLVIVFYTFTTKWSRFAHHLEIYMDSPATSDLGIL